ncbi:MAG: hypothetical protein GY948_13010 [Alphaproteobacteria bacterium]|nr:hypothetical protein [Alphaproteobacteria bacterium]
MSNLQQRLPEPTSGEICQVLGDILVNGADIHRCLAAQALGKIASPEGVQPLVTTLLDEDEDVRTDAAEALLRLADPRAGDQLLENLIGDPCSEVKLAAIGALAKLKDERAIPWLRRMLRGRDEEIVWDEEEFYATGWDDWVEIQARSVAALAEMNVQVAVPDIVAAIRDDDAPDFSEYAFRALAQLGRAGIDALAAFLEDEPVRLRRRAAAALGASSVPEAAGALAQALADLAPEVRLAALRARAGTCADDSCLTVLFDDPNPNVRAEAVRLVGARFPEQLRPLLDDRSECVRAATLQSLTGVAGRFVDDDVIVRMRTLLADRSTEVSASAARALSATAPHAAMDDLTVLLTDRNRPVEVRLGALKGLAEIGNEAAASALAGVIDDEMRPLRLEAMTALARLAARDANWPNIAGETLLAVLREAHKPDPGGHEPEQHAVDPAIEQQSCGAAEPEPEEVPKQTPTSTLAAILDDTPEVAATLSLPEKGQELSQADMERLAIAKRVKGKRRVVSASEIDVPADVRRFAARVLGDLDHPDVARELALALTTKDAEMRKAAADSLARIGARVSPLHSDVANALKTAAETVSLDTKLLLIRALGACNSADVSGVLLDLLGDGDSFVRTEAVRALSCLGQAGEQIEPLLADADPSVRLCAAEAVAKSAGSRSLMPLVDFAFSFEGRHGLEAARLLKEVDAVGASALFVDALRNPERTRTWPVAIAALAELNHSGTSKHTEAAGNGPHEQ